MLKHAYIAPTLLTCLNLPNNVKELRYFLSMIQYYQDIWTKHSKMLAPPSNLVGECGETKTTNKNKTKKKPWQQWDPKYQQVFENVKATIAKEVVLASPDFSKSLRYTRTPPQWNWEP
jgi:hypothetical protein